MHAIRASVFLLASSLRPSPSLGGPAGRSARRDLAFSGRTSRIPSEQFGTGSQPALVKHPRRCWKLVTDITLRFDVRISADQPAHVP